jgi:predicted nucleic acid-binding protein
MSAMSAEGRAYLDTSAVAKWYLNFATFHDDIAAGFLSLCPTDDMRFDEAVSLIARYPEHPLRTLDALHLAVARHEQVDAIATADGVMADTAEALGFAVARF